MATESVKLSAKLPQGVKASDAKIAVDKAIKDSLTTLGVLPESITIQQGGNNQNQNQQGGVRKSKKSKKSAKKSAKKSLRRRR